MVPRLIAPCLMIVCLLTGCANTTALPLTIDGYCQMWKGRFPLKLSRHDTAQTKREIIELNETYLRQCEGGENASQIQSSTGSGGSRLSGETLGKEAP